MKTSQLAGFSLCLMALCLMALPGCGSMSLEEKRVDYKSGAVKTPSLEIPPDLTSPSAQDQYAIPEGGEKVASYSDYAKDGTTPQARAASGVLPQFRNVHMERSGTLRWLVVEDKAENLWPQIKAFWQESGFAIKSENMPAGVIETDWAENRAKIPQGGLRSVIGKVLDNLYSSGEQDMYRTRLERSKDGNTTEIYISHYGKEEVLSKDQSTTKWQSRANDPGLEATMLQMLMAKLGGAAEAQAKASQPQEATARDVSSAEAADVKLQGAVDGSKKILMGEAFDKSWRKVGLALEHAGMMVEDKDRANGLYFVRVTEPGKKEGLGKLAFWRSAEAKVARYQVSVRESGPGVEVAAASADGASNPESQRIIELLYNQLIK